MDTITRRLAVIHPTQYIHGYTSTTEDPQMKPNSPNLVELPPNSRSDLPSRELWKDPNVRFLHETSSQQLDRISMLFEITNENFAYFSHCARCQPHSNDTIPKNQQVIIR